MNTFLQKTVVVTGAAGGIGSACVQTFLAAGASVIGTDIAEQGALQFSGEKYRFLHADITREEEVARLVAESLKAFGTVDVLVNNAAVLTPCAPVDQTTLEEFERVMAVNVRAVFLCSKLFLPALRRSRGCLINVSSMAGVTGEKSHAVYSASKGAVNALTQAMAVDYGPCGVRVNAVCPGGVKTPNSDAVIQASPDAEQIIRMRDSLHALGSTALPGQVADVIAFLASPAASFMTGALVPVSGGMECGYGIKY